MLNRFSAAFLNRRVLALCAVFAMQVIAVHAIDIREELAKLPDFTKIPAQLGPWKLAREVDIEPEVLDALHPDEYVSRVYRKDAASAEISLFSAYFASTGSSHHPHSPKMCLPGSGWKEINDHVIQVPLNGQLTVPVNDYVLEKDSQRIVVMYWYQNKRHTWAQEFEAKLYLLPDLLAHHRSDAAIVRLVTTVNSTEVQSGLESCREFLRQLYPILQERFSKT